MSGEGTKRAKVVTQLPIEEALQSTDSRQLVSAVQRPEMNEDLALGVLRRKDLPFGVLDALAMNKPLLKSRKVLLGLVQHAKTPKHVAIPLARQLFPFELMQVAVTVTASPDMKHICEDLLLMKMGTVSLGEKLTLAKRASGKIASQLLLDSDEMVVETALMNPFLTEHWITRALVHEEAPPKLAELITRAEKWSYRPDVRIALLRNRYTPLARCIEYAKQLRPEMLYEILRHSKLDQKTKEYLIQTSRKKSIRE